MFFETLRNVLLGLLAILVLYYALETSRPSTSVQPMQVPTVTPNAPSDAKDLYDFLNSSTVVNAKESFLAPHRPVVATQESFLAAHPVAAATPYAALPPDPQGFDEMQKGFDAIQPF